MKQYCSHEEFEFIPPGDMQHYCSHEEFELITPGEYETVLFT